MAFTEEQKQAIHDNLYNALKGYASIQDINYAASRIIEDPSPENLDRIREGLIAVSAPTASGIITPDNQIKNIIKNELVYMQSDVAEQTEEFIEENESEVYPISGTIELLGTVTFGSYEQDNNSENGKEPVEWYIMSIDEENKKMMLMSKYVLDVAPWVSSSSITPATWEESYIRQKINSSGFINKMFTEDEQQYLVPSLIDMPSVNDVSSGNPTTDTIFIPSYDEIKDLSNNIRVANQTDWLWNYCVNNDLKYIVDPSPESAIYPRANYGTRTLYAENSVYAQLKNGTLTGDRITSNRRQGIRPCIYVKLPKD